MHIRNPIEWSGAQLAQAAHGLGAAYRSLHHVQETVRTPPPAVKRIGVADLRAALASGYRDMAAYRSDVLFIGVIYAIAGLVLARFAFGMDMLPMLFPLVFGFALVGPFAAVGLYEMSKRREEGSEISWISAATMVREPAFASIALLGLLMMVIFLLWLGAAWLIFNTTIGPQPFTTIPAFLHAVFQTNAGWAMIAIGSGVGLLFAIVAMTLGVASFPLLVDRDVGFDTAIKTSYRAVRANPLVMTLWGVIVAALLVVGSLPLFAGLIVVFPLLGHATWHLYRRLVER